MSFAYESTLLSSPLTRSLALNIISRIYLYKEIDSFSRVLCRPKRLCVCAFAPFLAIVLNAKALFEHTQLAH